MYICLRKYRSPASAVAECRPTFLCPWQLLLTSQSEASLILKYHEGKRAPPPPPPPPPTKGQVHHILSFSPFTLYFRTYSFPSSFPSATDIRHKKKPSPTPPPSLSHYFSLFSPEALSSSGKGESGREKEKIERTSFLPPQSLSGGGGKGRRFSLGGEADGEGGLWRNKDLLREVRKLFLFP